MGSGSPLILSPRRYADMRASMERDRVPTPDLLGGALSWMGMDVQSNPMFPMETQCGKCAGTGSGGEESTYCRRCKGAGAIRTVGVMLGTPLTIITEPLPKLFEPSFPRSLVPAPRLCRGLP